MKKYEKMGTNENLGWCKPYLGDGVAVAVMEGSAVAVRVDGRDYLTAKTVPAALERLARRINPDFASYDAYDSLHVALDGDLRECGCGSCPWRDDCDAMEVDAQC